jgi:hypothetical protein
MSLRTLFVRPLGLSLLALVAGCSSDPVVNSGDSSDVRTRDDAGTGAAATTDTTSGSGSGASDTGTPALDVETDAPADTTADTASDTAADTAADTAPDTTPPTPVDCTAIPIAATTGETCVQGTASTCSPGAECIGLGTGLGAKCLQICTPGQCSDICGAQGTCSGLADQNNNPLLRDLDGDGIDDEVGGCFPVVQAFSLCGTPTTGGCAEGQICVGDETAANCTPTCTTPGDSCGRFNGVEALCNLTLQATDGTEQPACSIDCAATADCPAGLTCVPITGGSICLER